MSDARLSRGALPNRLSDFAGSLIPPAASTTGFCPGISHRTGERVVLDAVREFKAPFDPASVVAELVTTLRALRSRRDLQPLVSRSGADLQKFGSAATVGDGVPLKNDRPREDCASR